MRRWTKASIIVVLSVVLLASIGKLIGPILNDAGEEEYSSLVDETNEGEIQVTFESEVPAYTPETDRIFVYIDEKSHYKYIAFPMNKSGENRWSATIHIDGDLETIRYKYNRNAFGYSTDEEFFPDSPDTRRTLNITGKKISASDNVEKWRWLNPEKSSAEISTFVPSNLPERDQPFVMGVALWDYHNPIFPEYLPSTLDGIKDRGFGHVQTHYFVTYIEGYDPPMLRSIAEEERAKMQFYIDEIKRRDLIPVLSIMYQIDPNNNLLIQNVLSAQKTDDWYRTFIAQWRSDVVKALKFAEENEIPIVLISDTWTSYNYQSEEQKALVSDLVNDAYDEFNSVYSGILVSSFFDNPPFDYYKKVDWLGGVWWHDITDERNPTVEELAAGAQEAYDTVYKPAHDKYGKPIFFQQTAYAAYDGAAGAKVVNTEGPEIAELYPYNDAWPADFQEQVDAYEAFFRVASKEEAVVGAMAFGYSYWDTHDKAFSIRAKPAEDVWMRWNEIL